MPDTSPIVLVNRTEEPLGFTADGVHHILTPGENYGYFRWQIPYATAQNPVMGSENYYSLDFQSKIGVKGDDKYPCDPIPVEELVASLDQVERFNRKESGMTPGTVVKNRNMPKGRMGGVATSAGQNAFAVGR